MNAGTCWEQEYNRPNGLSVEKAPKSDLYLLPFLVTFPSIFNTLGFNIVTASNDVWHSVETGQEIYV